ncbi:MAG TPA: hypothetical protein VIK56_01265, partial [Rhodoferax sp.]
MATPLPVAREGRMGEILGVQSQRGFKTRRGNVNSGGRWSDCHGPFCNSAVQRKPTTTNGWFLEVQLQLLGLDLSLQTANTSNT